MPLTLRAQDWFHPDGFPLAVERRNPQGPFERHGHDFSEVVVVTSGQGTHHIGRDGWPLSAGDVFVVKGPEVHEYCDLVDLNLINVLFQPEKLNLEAEDLAALPGYHALFRLEPQWRRRHKFQSRLHLSPASLTRVTALIDQLDAELRTREAGFRSLAVALFIQMIVFISRTYGRARAPDAQALLRIAATITYLETHFAAEVQLDDLANMAHMSKRAYLRAFQAATGQSPIAYLLQTRLDRAAALLRGSAEPITEVAYCTGFTDSNYFARQFRRVTGMTPRAYRAAARPRPV